MFIYDCDGFAGHMVNPTWDAADDEEQFGPEGCLSIPGLRFDCRRHQHVVAPGWDLHGEPDTVEGTALLARCIQHETDHLDGVLFLDKLDPETRTQAMAEIRGRRGSTPPASPTVKVSPHPLFGRARYGRCASSSRAPPSPRCPPCARCSLGPARGRRPS